MFIYCYYYLSVSDPKNLIFSCCCCYRGDRQRLGTAIAAYLEYQKICGSNFPRQRTHTNEDQKIQNTISRNWLDLDIYSMQKFLEDVSGPLKVPSHRRLVN